MILHGHALDILKDVDDGFFDCMITSPPYWGLRDYGLEPLVWDGELDCEHEWNGENIKWHSGTNAGEKQLTTGSFHNDHITQSAFCSLCGAWRGSLGLEPTFQLYIAHLMQIFDEVKRVLKPTGTCWVVIGDSYSGSGKGAWSNKDVQKEVYVPDKRPKLIETLPSKCLCQIPSRFAIAMTDAGWILRNEIPWWKRNCMPSSAKDRFTVDFEKVFFFTKQGKYWFEQQFDIVANSTVRRVELAESRGKVENEIKAPVTNSYKRCTSAAVSVDKYQDERDHLVCKPNPQGRNKRCVWDITTKPFPGAHFAVFPPKLVEPMLLAGCPEDGWVLDPFSGAGTVGVVAKEQNKNFVGIELSKEYCDKSDNRIETGKYE